MLPYILFAGAHFGLDLYRALGYRKIAQENENYLKRQYADNKRFWDDYYKNTGFHPKYPTRAGSDINMAAFYQAKWNSQNWWLSPAYSGMSSIYATGSLYR